MAREGVPLLVIQRQLGHANLAITSIYLQGIDNDEIIDTIHRRRPPMIPATAGLDLRNAGHGVAVGTGRVDPVAAAPAGQDVSCAFAADEVVATQRVDLIPARAADDHIGLIIVLAPRARLIALSFAVRIQPPS
jgi:hypothetical protein